MTSIISTNSIAQPFYQVDGNPSSPNFGQPVSDEQGSYTLAGTQASPGIPSLAGNTGTTGANGLQINVVGGSYIWAYQLGGTTPSLKLQTLGPDNATWMDVATVTATGQQGVVIGNNATVRLLNGTANAITNLFSTLS